MFIAQHVPTLALSASHLSRLLVPMNKKLYLYHVMNLCILSTPIEMSDYGVSQSSLLHRTMSGALVLLFD